MLQLREYQGDLGAIGGLVSSIRNGHKQILLQASTGAGKTIIASSMIQRAVNKGNKCLFVAHRKEIITQTSEKLHGFGIEHGVIMAGHNGYAPSLPVQLASIQTLSNRHKPHADLVIIDETHLACSASFQKIIEHYSGSIIIGLTATPTRLDGRGLGEIYTDMVQVVSMRRLIDDGHLVQPRVFAPFTPDLGKFKTVRGDYDATQISEEMDKASITGDIVKHWQTHAFERKTICFASSIAHSQHIVDEFNAAGISAKHLDGTTNAALRDKTLQEWREGKFHVLSNMGLFIEGLDVPEVSCCILARPTQSVTIYLQAVGRAMRPAKGKTNCIILDHAGLTHSHGLVDEEREWSLEGKKKKSRKGEQEKAPSVTVCDSCFCAYSRVLSPDACPECGKVTERKGREIEINADENLIELTPEMMQAIKQRKKDELKSARTKDELITLGKSRGYNFPHAWADRILGQRHEWAAKRGGMVHG
jgi:superfamily II DNA or RNA helicase